MKTRSLFTPFVMLCGAIVLAGCASTKPQVAPAAHDGRQPPHVAATPVPPLPQHAFLDANAFRKLDLDADGSITLEEWQQCDKSADAHDNFRSLDENGDGQINLAEFLTQAPKHSERYHFLGETDKTDDSFVSSDKEVFQNPGWHLFSFHF